MRRIGRRAIDIDSDRQLIGKASTLSLKDSILRKKKPTMSKMIACCGLVCTCCPTFIATQNNDDNARAMTATYYRKKYGFDLKPEEINCDGCLSSGENRIGYCQTCEVRQCCQERGLENCALCERQPCEKLIQFHEFSPDAKKCFEQLKVRIGSE